MAIVSLGTVKNLGAPNEKNKIKGKHVLDVGVM
jgi:hypothetical protein